MRAHFFGRCVPALGMDGAAAAGKLCVILPAHVSLLRPPATHPHTHTPHTRTHTHTHKCALQWNAQIAKNKAATCACQSVTRCIASVHSYTDKATLGSVNDVTLTMASLGYSAIFLTERVM